MFLNAFVVFVVKYSNNEKSIFYIFKKKKKYEQIL